MIDSAKDSVLPLENDNIKKLLGTPTTEDEILKEEAQDNYCETTTLRKDCQGLEFLLDDGGLFTRKSNIGETTQLLVSKSI